MEQKPHNRSLSGWRKVLLLLKDEWGRASSEIFVFFMKMLNQSIIKSLCSSMLAFSCSKFGISYSFHFLNNFPSRITFYFPSDIALKILRENDEICVLGFTDWHSHMWKSSISNEEHQRWLSLPFSSQMTLICSSN